MVITSNSGGPALLTWIESAIEFFSAEVFTLSIPVLERKLLGSCRQKCRRNAAFAIAAGAARIVSVSGAVVLALTAIQEAMRGV